MIDLIFILILTIIIIIMMFLLLTFPKKYYKIEEECEKNARKNILIEEVKRLRFKKYDLNQRISLFCLEYSKQFNIFLEECRKNKIFPEDITEKMTTREFATMLRHSPWYLVKEHKSIKIKNEEE